MAHYVLTPSSYVKKRKPAPAPDAQHHTQNWERFPLVVVEHALSYDGSCQNDYVVQLDSGDWEWCRDVFLQDIGSFLNILSTSAQNPTTPNQTPQKL